MKHLRTANLGCDAEINGAIATLVLAFAADPVARWIYRALGSISAAYCSIVPRAWSGIV